MSKNENLPLAPEPAGQGAPRAPGSTDTGAATTASGSAVPLSAAATIDTLLPEGTGRQIGPYKLLQLIGEGGFGSVFMAEQTEPVKRRVAVKVIKKGMDTRQVIARFEQERQALAMMDHPGIARVLDAGETETGQPYFVMELVDGEPVTAHCDPNKLSIPARLELFVQVCSAVQHAHQKGIIHRDLKPSNVPRLRRRRQASAKVIDFGSPRPEANSPRGRSSPGTGSLIGTPEYMSPGAGQGRWTSTPRTDVYALGVLLYELLTGSTPFDSRRLRSAAFAEIARIIREDDPPSPSSRLSQSAATLVTVAARRHTEPRKLSSMLRGELDWSVMKALEKERQRRYETASGLAMDVRRYLAEASPRRRRERCTGSEVRRAPPARWRRRARGRRLCWWPSSGSPGRRGWRALARKARRIAESRRTCSRALSWRRQGARYDDAPGDDDGRRRGPDREGRPRAIPGGRAATQGDDRHRLPRAGPLRRGGEDARAGRSAGTIAAQRGPRETAEALNQAQLFKSRTSWRKPNRSTARRWRWTSGSSRETTPRVALRPQQPRQLV
ncbi:MAG: serine/threonine protein kinase [Holophagales bacterium]|nr:serine/threonine protein kinase [Holophagales bacterium]